VEPIAAEGSAAVAVTPERKVETVAEASALVADRRRARQQAAVPRQPVVPELLPMTLLRLELRLAKRRLPRLVAEMAVVETQPVEMAAVAAGVVGAVAECRFGSRPRPASTLLQ